MIKADPDDPFAEIRDAVARLCAQFPAPYWRQMDREQAYPTAFVQALTQAGYLAAAGLYAMQHNINRLAEDHAHAKQLADALKECSWVGEIFPVETNIVIFEVAGKRDFDSVGASAGDNHSGEESELGSGFQNAQEVVAKLLSHNIRVSAMSPTHIRLVTHLDVSSGQIEQVVRTFAEFSRN